MKQLILTILCAIGCATWSQAELVENGDFADDMAYWRLNIANGYGDPSPDCAVVEGALECRKLRDVGQGYMHLMQAVDIRKGKTYKLTYEVKGSGGVYRTSVQHVFKEKHHISKKLAPTESWQAVEEEFEGAYDTGEKWYKKFRKATKKSKLGERGTPIKNLKEIQETKRADPPVHSLLIFSLAELKGSFAVRNISLVEVE